MSTFEAPATPSAGSSDQKPDSAIPGKFWAIAGVIALALGVGGFFIGSAVKKSDYDKGKPAYNEIYKAGYAAGQTTGNAAGQKAGEQLGKKQGLEQGTKAGLNLGVKKGEAQGITTGRSEGAARGALAALGGFSNWTPNAPYVTVFQPGTVKEVPYRVVTRTLMKPGYSYYLCNGGAEACSQKLPSDGNL